MSGKANTRAMCEQLRLPHLREIIEYMDVPLTIKDARLIIRDYLLTAFPERHWTSLEELIEQLEEDGLAYMDEHDQSRMNPKYTAMVLEMEANERVRKRKEYDREVKQFRKRNPGIKATTAELRSMIPPDQWEANDTVADASDDEPPARDRATLGQTMMQMMTEMRKEMAELKKSIPKKDE
jgi:hypothetical protein